MRGHKLIYLLSIAWTGLFGYFLWYLSWPVTEGQVSEVKEVVASSSKIRSPRRYRRLTFSFSVNGVICFSSRQGLFFPNALAPRKLLGQSVEIRMCISNQRISCLSRPVFEFFLFVCISLIIGLVGVLYVFL